MDPDGDYESRHSIRSTASNDVDVADISSPSKIFSPNDDTKLPAKPTKGKDAYDGPTAPPMEDAPSPAVPSAAAAAAASSSHRPAMEPRGAAYDDLMGGKMDLASPDEAPISNSVAVPIGFDSDDMTLPEAKALPILSSTANEGTKMPSATLEELDVEVPCARDSEAQVDEEEPTPVPLPSSEEGDQSSTPPDETSNENGMSTNQVVKETSTSGRCTRRKKLYCGSIIAFFAVLGTVLGVLFDTSRGLFILAGYPKCNAAYFVYIGDGQCDGGLYDTAECGWDGGDCEEFNSRYPNCDVSRPKNINDGYCNDYGDYKTAKCGWDGGDCLFKKKYDRACRGTIGSTWSYKTRAWCQDKCMAEGADCEAYDYNFDTDNCRLFSSFSPTSSNDDMNCWVKEASALEAEEIIEKLSECIAGDPATDGVNQSCVGGVLSTLSQDTIDKLTPCAGRVVNEWKACIFGQFLN